jgi:hypothetical protein
MILRKLPAALLGAVLAAMVLPGPITATGTAEDDTLGVLEDSGATVVDVLANDAATEVTSIGLASNGTALLTAGVVTYEPDPHYNGPDSFTYEVDGGAGEATVSVTVTAVNDAPTITSGADVSVDEDSGSTTAAGWATGISAGPANESGQALTLTVVATDSALFAAGPDVDELTGDLTFTPAVDAFGSTNVDITVSDDGGTGAGGDDTTVVSFSITIDAVNDAPAFTPGADQVVPEDAGPQAVAGWAAGIAAGPANESGQDLAFTLTPVNPSLFTAGPAVSATTGDLTYTPADDATGTTSIDVELRDNGTTANGGVDTATAMFSITLVGVNDDPTALDDTLEVDEGDPATEVDVLANDEQAPDTGETLAVTAVGTASRGTASLVAGVVRYQPSADEYGSDTFTYTIVDGNGGSDTAIVNVTIAPVNDVPSFTKGPDQSVNEDAGAQSVGTWATSISTGPPNESAQVPSFDVAADNTGLFSVQPAISAAGTLTYTPAPNANGSATVTVSLSDGGGIANGGVETSPAQTFTITVLSVNDAPSFTRGADQSTSEDAPAQTIGTWATAISPGPADESGQVLVFEVSTDNTALFSAQPAVSATGTLTYTPAPDANGSATVTVSLSDNGGRARGGINASDDQAFTITVGEVNDPPSFTAGANPTVLEDSGPASLGGWATSIKAGPPDESGQVLTFHVTAATPSLFAVQPAVDPLTGTLTFTPATGAYGSSTVSVYATDNGGGANQSATVDITITVTPVNDAPTFVKGADQAVAEDAGAQSVTGWATAITTGPGDGPQALTFTITGNTNPTLFAAGPAIAADGTLTYTPATNANGSADIAVVLADDGGTANGGVNASAGQTFTILVNAVNDVPSFTKGANQAANEDAGAQTAIGWATAISRGPADESSQSLTFHVAAANPALFSVQPAVSPATGTLTWTPADNANGSTTVDIHLEDDGTGTNTSAVQQFTITVNQVNDAPSFTKGGNQAVAEDASAQSVTGWATAASPGPANESGQTVTFNVTNDATALFSSQPAVASNGTLTYTPAPNANGAATVSVRAQDTGGTANGGVNQSAIQTFTITIAPVNDTPSFTKGADELVNEDAGARAVTGWATTITKGPADESGQTLTFTASNDNPALFSTQPAVSATGTLTYTPVANASGSATVSVVLADDGGGADTSAAQEFTITVRAVNDAPSFTKGGDQQALEDAGPQTVTGWATGLSAGPPDEAAQVLAFSVIGTTNDALFAAGPAVDAVTGDLTWTPAADANGTAVVTLRLADDGGTANGGLDGAVQAFAITVGAVNDAPSFTDTGDVGAARSATLVPQAIPGWAAAISAGPADEAGQVLTFEVTNSNPGLFAVAPEVDADGTLTFTPAINTTDAAEVTVTLADDGGTADGGADTSTPHTFTITVSGDNQPPVAGNDPVTVRLAGPTSIDVLADDSGGPGEPGDPVRVTAAYGASRGFVTIAPDGSSVTYDPIGCSTGTDSFKYVITDGGGLVSAPATVLVTIASPTSYPAADGPRPSLVSGSTISSTVRVKLAWCGTAGSRKITSYGLARSINGGTFSTVISSTTATSATRGIPFAPTSFQYRARVTAPNGVAYGYGPAFAITRLQENAAQITYAGSWGTKSTSKASGDRMRYASSTSASATFTVSGTRQVGIVAPNGPGYGSMKVYVNGTYVGRFSQAASSTVYRRLLYVRTLDPGRTYTIKLKPAGNGRVYLDAVLVLK